ncbi:trypsin-like serine protease [Streptomyces coffeae]|uniref:Trypsin-like serine protease n=1 Tax=Streptomyces coffeae TaxID=621382 RepID=A0ABS1NCK8_9ACTN|nr:trypsin-like serine protease [Streptomyces coffeae]MBL1097788.1 trypsin-like serine protease [Streptomyces coffeae]
MASTETAYAPRGSLNSQPVPSSVVGIGADDGYRFSGALIGSRWVLTANPCLGDTGYSVERGDGKSVRVDQQYKAPAGDMALLHLASPLDGAKTGSVIDGYVQLAAGTDPPPQAGDVVYAMGYGRGGLGVVAEQQITSYGPDGSYGMTGSASALGKAVAFVGESGGPVLRSDGKSGLTLIGVVSGGTVYTEGDLCMWFAGGPTIWSTDSNGAINRDWIKKATGI